MKYITPVPSSKAHGLAGDVYRQIKRDFGALVDPFTVHSISPRLMAAVWGACRESELVGVVPREVKETVAVTISRANDVSFCVDAHVVMLHALRAHGVARSLTHDRLDRLPQGTRAACEWSRATVRRASADVPYSDREAAEMIGTAVFFHYMNRVAAVLLDDTPLPFSQPWMKGFLSRAAGWYFSFAARRFKAPGASLVFLPDAKLPDDMAWAAASETLTGAWARFAREIDRIGQATLSDKTRSLANDCIDEWHAGGMAANGELVDEFVARANSNERAAARLVLLTAIAPHTVDAAVIHDFTASHREQDELLHAISWASFAAARRIGAKLAPSGVCA
jgi:AhpD family alkylhydroperoxidase